MYIDNRYRQQEAYVSSAHMFSIFPWWSANLSVDAQWNRLEADLVDFVYPKDTPSLRPRPLPSSSAASPYREACSTPM